MNVTRWRSLTVQGICAALLLAGCGAIVVRSISSSSSAPSGPHTVSLPMTQLPGPGVSAGSGGATLQVRTGTPKLTIGMANLGLTGSLVEVSTPGGSPAAQLQVTGGAGPGGSALVSVSAKDAASVTVTLNTAVGWRLELASGTKQTIADLRHGRVASVAITAGSDLLDLLMPAPRGSVPIRLAAGASRFLLSVPHGSAVRVTAAKGAGQVSLEGAKHVAVPDGSVFTTPGWAAGTAGFDIDATAGAARLTVTARAG
ncbi:hypothetical protein EAS64_13725 [Trebonia kvetii]|uniref:Uncharacterized protein n=1 Tax=Trebonia kvetii TaxID=2480626 RepID=A0A6P2C2G7_9ACTN|nr:hypothetical protein [Trebonia kvetii]TVZ05574.1 hypothetical protein EAS64_13725 [Trebonia kvetii]